VHTRKKKMPSIAKGIPENLPSLSYAYRLTRKASRLGFDWPDLAGALKKMDEELGEFHETLAQPPHHHRGVARGHSLRVATPVRPPHRLGGVAKSRSLHVATPPLRDRRRIGEELGDLLFVLVNVARLLQIDPEQTLKRTIGKFCARFFYIETSLGRAGKTVQESSLNELDRLWDEAKRKKKY
jgi:uncharacterized protein YabN with tetrapyrrole methylase and pyrophosphatase domain